MAGIFGFFDFTKPGKGIEADEPEKRAFFRYLDILWLRKGKLFVMNIMLFLCALPAIIAFHLYFFEPLINHLMPEGEEYAGTLFLAFFSFFFSLPPQVLTVLFVVSVFLLGPATCGFTYMLRNFVRREHAWLSDFWQRAKMNFKQGIFLGILDTTMFYIGFFNISLLFNVGTSEVPPFITTGAVIVFFIYLCMRNTLYLMAVTVELNNFNLVRNALILTFAGFGRHLLTGLINGVIIVLVLLVNSFAEIITLPLFLLSLMGMNSVFICYPLVDKFLIRPQLESDEPEIIEDDNAPE